MSTREGLGTLLDPRFPGASECLNASALNFFLGREIERAQRYSSYVSYVLFQLVDAGEGIEKLEEMAWTLQHEIRSTDWLGTADESTLGLVLLNCSRSKTSMVLSRLKLPLLAGPLKNQDPMSLKAASALFPTEANSMASLKRLAQARLDRLSSH